MNHGSDWVEPIARGLYAEIALIEEQHVTHYESLRDPLDSWLKQFVFHKYNEIYLYWSMLQNEEDRRIKSIWKLHLDMEIGQLHAACDLLRKYEGIEPEELLPKELPDTPVTFEPNKDYVREILATQLELATDGPDYVAATDLPPDHRSRRYREIMNEGGAPSEDGPRGLGQRLRANARRIPEWCRHPRARRPRSADHRRQLHRVRERPPTTLSSASCPRSTAPTGRSTLIPPAASPNATS